MRRLEEQARILPRGRALIWGVLLAVPVCFWNAWQPTGTIYSLIFSTMAALIVLVFVNRALHRFAPCLARWSSSMHL